MPFNYLLILCALKIFTISFISFSSLLKCLDASSVRGFNSKIFSYQEILTLIEKLKISDFKTINGSYQLIARLSAEAFVRYSNYLKFGLVNPKKVFLRYYIYTKQAYSAFTYSILNSVSIINALKALQN